MDKDDAEYALSQLLQKWGAHKVPADHVPSHLKGPLTPVSCPRESQVDGFKKLHLAATSGRSMGCGRCTTCNSFTFPDWKHHNAQGSDHRECARCSKRYTWRASWETPNETSTETIEDKEWAPIEEPGRLTDESGSPISGSSRSADSSSEDRWPKDTETSMEVKHQPQ